MLIWVRVAAGGLPKASEWMSTDRLILTSRFSSVQFYHLSHVIITVIWLTIGRFYVLTKVLFHVPYFKVLQFSLMSENNLGAKFVNVKLHAFHCIVTHLIAHSNITVMTRDQCVKTWSNDNSCFYCHCVTQWHISLTLQLVSVIRKLFSSRVCHNISINISSLFAWIENV